MRSLPVTAIKGIGPVTQKKLAEAGILTSRDLIGKALKSEDRKKLFVETELSLGDLRKWAGYSTLFMIKGIAEKNAAVLYRAGIKNVGQLADANHLQLFELVKNLKPEKDETIKVMSVKVAEEWIEQAKKTLATLFPLPVEISTNPSPRNLQMIDNYINNLVFFKNWAQLKSLGETLLIASQKRAEMLSNECTASPPASDTKTPKKLSAQEKHLLKEFLLKKGHKSDSVDKFIDLEDEIEINREKVEKALKSRLKHDLKFMGFLSKTGALCFFAGLENERKIKLLISPEVINEINRQSVFFLQDSVNHFQNKLKLVISGMETEMAAENPERVKQKSLDYLWNFKPELKNLQEITTLAKNLFPLVEEKITPDHQHLILSIWNLLEETINLHTKCLFNLVYLSNKNPFSESKFSEELNELKQSGLTNGGLIQAQEYKTPSTPGNLKSGEKIKISGIVKHSNKTRKSEIPEFNLKTKDDELNVFIDKIKYKEIIPKENSVAEVAGTVVIKENKPVLQVTNHTSLHKNSLSDLNQLYFATTGINEKEFNSSQFIIYPETIRNTVKNYWRK